jgi:RNA polymerase sigma-70 factor (ECF subfamily)
MHVKEHWLVWRILRDDKRAGEEFVAVHYPRIFRLLRYLTGRPDIAEDLTQQAFVRAWQALPTFRHQSSLATWLHRIAYHEYTHWLRDRREHASLDSAAHLASPPNCHEWETLVLPHALAQLSPEHREAFLLYHIQELSVGEAAAILEVPPGTVKSRLFTARQRLRELLETDVASVALPAPSPTSAALAVAPPQKEILHELSSH